MVIDDLADRKHKCDLLLDQTYGRNSEDYGALVPGKCQLLMGSEYSLLRPEFAQWREYSLQRRDNTELKKLLITILIFVLSLLMVLVSSIKVFGNAFLSFFLISIAGNSKNLAAAALVVLTDCILAVYA